MSVRSPGTQSLDPSDPSRIGDYELLAQLGIGGMGTVYLGRGRDDQPVAVKIVHPHLAIDPEFRARFASEVLAGRRVPPFCSAKVIDSGTHQGRPYLVTEFIDGVPLSQVVAEDGPLDLPSLHALALGTAAGLAAIHSVGLVHRDVKPSNIMLTLGGVRIIDFGISRALDDTGDYTRTGVVMGSLGWVAPEQLGGESPSPPMDVFGWGCVVAFAATGDHPFGGTDLNSRAWRVLHGGPDLDGVPEPLRPVVQAALQRDPARRPTTRELLLTLVGAQVDQIAPARSDRLIGAIPRKAAGTFAAAVPLALALVIGAASAVEIGEGIDQPSTSVTQTPSAHPTAKPNKPDRGRRVAQPTGSGSASVSQPGSPSPHSASMAMELGPADSPSSTSPAPATSTTQPDPDPDPTESRTKKPKDSADPEP